MLGQCQPAMAGCSILQFAVPGSHFAQHQTACSSSFPLSHSLIKDRL